MNHDRVPSQKEKGKDEVPPENNYGVRNPSPNINEKNQVSPRNAQGDNG